MARCRQLSSLSHLPWPDKDEARDNRLCAVNGLVQASCSFWVLWHGAKEVWGKHSLQEGRSNSVCHRTATQKYSCPMSHPWCVYLESRLHQSTFNFPPHLRRLQAPCTLETKGTAQSTLQVCFLPLLPFSLTFHFQVRLIPFSVIRKPTNVKR